MNTTKTGLQELTERTAAANLDSLALVEVSGDDAQAFLQGQFSNDVDAINAGGCQLNAYCNPKGRVLALPRLVRCGDGFWMIVPAGVADAFVNRLKMFVLRARVAIALKPEVALLGLIGGADDGHDAGDGVHRVPVDGVIPRQILIGERPALDAFAAANEFDRKPDDNLWRLVDIHSGIPQIYPQTAGEFIPQTINLDWVDGVSFTKGCYPGQEIVARLRYRGKVKQRMLAGAVRGIESLAPGEPVYSDRRAAQKAGLVVDAVETGGGEFTLSATAPASPDEQGVLRVGPGASTGGGVEIARLPHPAAAH